MFRQKDLKISRFPVRTVIALIGAGAVLILVVLALMRGNDGIDSGTYQLVKLENGESYVGRLEGVGGDYATLSSPFIYQEPKADQDNDGEIQLLRVSSVDGSLRVATDKIVYWGNLPKEGRVVSAIESAD